MDFRENKIEIAMLACGALVILGLFKLFGAMETSPAIAEKAINYEMPHPKSDFAGDFDLEGREIDRRLVDGFAKKKKDEKKADDAKKAAAATAAKPAAKTAAAKAGDAKKKEVDVNVVDGTPDKPLGSDESLNGQTQTVRMTRETAAAGATDKTDEDNKDKLSPDQWRALVLGAPTKENMNKLVAAFGAGETDANTFFGIVEDLMQSQKPDSQSLGLYGLQSVVSARSFALVVHNMDKFDPTVKTAANSYLMAYTQSNRLGSLAQVLQTNDVTVATKGVEVLMAGLQAARNGTAPTSPRDARGEIQAASLTSFARFIPILQNWKKSGDSQLVSLADGALAQLQTTAS